MLQFIIDSIILSIVGAIVSYCVAQKPATPDQSGAIKNAGLQTRQITIQTVDQRQIPIQAQIAATPAEQQSPLILCNGFADGAGLLFTFPQPMPLGAWMKNCSAAIDVLFIAPDHTISKLATDDPENPEPLSSQGDATAVLEIKAGSIAALGIKAGDKVNY